MLWKDLKKPTNITNKQLLSLKVPYSTTTSNHIKRKTIFAAICILTLIALVTVIADFSSANSVAYADTIKGIGAGIYWDAACTNKTLSLNWGVIEAGSSSNLTVYVRNQYNSAVLLRLDGSNWIPIAASNYMSLSWNYTNQVLSVNQVIPIELTLTVQPTIMNITNFSFETILTTVAADQ